MIINDDESRFKFMILKNNKGIIIHLHYIQNKILMNANKVE